MNYLTISAARTAAAVRGLSGFQAAQEMRKAARAPLTTTYDIFLSHASEDAEVIAGVRTLLERDGVTVYVYWAEDDVERVTPATAARLRTRMQNCRSLIYASSKSSSDSKWMPWELGYFDGHKPERVAILPLVATTGGSFVGQEYLGIYPHIENVNWTGGRRGLGISLSATAAASIPTFIRSGVKPP